ncbi:unnamed protein product [Heligmosomoides polygyrus]|uniref:Uncharacterized protein n=1 Tax=Heligmosomoides polygyrus TaxID=6339 RepID=A0A183FWW4_HELPZ|nr:unnamed protein product [Heligmosomoides polygyrus]
MAESVASSGASRRRTNVAGGVPPETTMEVEDQMPAEEKTRFEELDELKVCDRLVKRVKDGELRLVAEVAKSLRTSDPRREAVEELASATTQDILDLVRMLRGSCEAKAKESECYAVVAASLECDGPEELVARIQQLVESSLVVSEVRAELRRQLDENERKGPGTGAIWITSPIS